MLHGVARGYRLLGEDHGAMGFLNLLVGGGQTLLMADIYI